PPKPPPPRLPRKPPPPERYPDDPPPSRSFCPGSSDRSRSSFQVPERSPRPTARPAAGRSRREAAIVAAAKIRKGIPAADRPRTPPMVERYGTVAGIVFRETKGICKR